MHEPLPLQSVQLGACQRLLHALDVSFQPLVLILINACSITCKENMFQVQPFQAAEQCHVKDLVHSVQQEVAKLKAGNAKLQSQCRDKADEEHMQNVSDNVLLGSADFASCHWHTCVIAILALCQLRVSDERC